MQKPRDDGLQSDGNPEQLELFPLDKKAEAAIPTGLDAQLYQNPSGSEETLCPVFIEAKQMLQMRYPNMGRAKRSLGLMITCGCRDCIESVPEVYDLLKWLHARVTTLSLNPEVRNAYAKKARLWAAKKEADELARNSSNRERAERDDHPDNQPRSRRRK